MNLGELPFEVVIPWRRPVESELRERNLRAVLAHLAAAGLPAERIRLANAYPWSPGRARNAGRRELEAPVVVFCDADTITPPEQIRSAVELALAEPGLVYGYDLYLRLGEPATVRMLDPTSAYWPTPERQIVGSASMGCAAIRCDAFDELGGFDERYVGWGYEDVELANRAGARWPIRRVAGVCFHLWHGERRPDDSPLDADGELVAFNRKRLELSAGVIAASPVA